MVKRSKRVQHTMLRFPMIHTLSMEEIHSLKVKCFIIFGPTVFMKALIKLIAYD